MRSDLKVRFDKIITPSEPSVITRPPIKSHPTFSPPGTCATPHYPSSPRQFEINYNNSINLNKGIFAFESKRPPQKTPPQKRKAPIIKYITTREFGILKMRRETKKDL
jgi:hypothetical protein